jgi:acetolactate synthase-1/2/3 large subunit
MGGSATEIVDALDRIPGRTALYCRQERVAVDICDGFARVTGEPGVVFVDAGPGAANTMAGVVNSWGDSVPSCSSPRSKIASRSSRNGSRRSFRSRTCSVR